MGSDARPTDCATCRQLNLVLVGAIVTQHTKDQRGRRLAGIIARSNSEVVSQCKRDYTNLARDYSTIALLAAIYVFYTIPLAAASALVDPTRLDELFPEFTKWSNNLGGLEVTKLLSGFMTALIWSTFFAICPIMFKSIANCGSNATSVASAEFKALHISGGSWC
jgi:hypothetical protein